MADLLGDRAVAVAESLGTVASAAEIDVSDEAAIEALVRKTETDHGRIDVFVSNAGYGRRGGVELPNDAFQKMWEVHVMAHVYAARHALPAMIERGEGYLLNTASAAGLLTQMDSVVYAVTKHGAVGLAEWLSIAHHHQGIRVSVLCPQAVATNIGQSLRGDDAVGIGAAGQAGKDGVLQASEVAEACVQAMRDERFWVLPHPEVATYVARKAADVDRWLSGMRRFGSRLVGDSGLPGDWLVS